MFIFAVSRDLCRRGNSISVGPKVGPTEIDLPLVDWILVAAFPREIIVAVLLTRCLVFWWSLSRALDDAARPDAREGRRIASHLFARPTSRLAFGRCLLSPCKREQTDASMFVLTFSPPGAPARALGVAERRVARRVRRGAFASTTWSLDGVGCAGARSGDEHLVGYRRMQSNRDPRRCPLKPIDVSGLCDAHQGKFKMLDAVFEQENGQLFVYSAKDAPDRPAPEDRCASTARARATTFRLTRTTRRVSMFATTTTKIFHACRVFPAGRASRPGFRPETSPCHAELLTAGPTPARIAANTSPTPRNSGRVTSPPWSACRW